MHIAEDFLHFIWKFRLYQAKSLNSSQGQSIEVVHPGISNTHAGPDFSQAKIRIQGVLWAGQVEIHVKASEWQLHGHQYDDAYENVILHVLYEDDQPVYRKDGTLLPALVLKGLFADHLLSNYLRLQQSFNHFPCEKQIGQVDPLYVNSFLSRLMIERMEQKAADVERILSLNKNDWNEAFYVILARSFGFKVNALPFELLAGSLKQSILYKYRDQPKCIEALIFGQAGFLDTDFIEEYPLSLKKEYGFLRRKHNLRPIPVSLWKFLRMRPQNFPTVRLAQFAALVVKSGQLFSSILHITDIKDLMAVFRALPVHSYWESHYHFNKPAREVITQPGKAAIDIILINTICQALFVYGRYIGDQHYTDRALSFLENIAPEKNAVVTLYEACGLKIDTAYLSQALLQLNKCYCVEKKCLNCSIGIKILKQ